VGYARSRGLSVRRACALLAVSRSTLGYCSRIAAKDAPIKAEMHEFSGQYPRFGYRRIQVFLERRGWPWPHDVYFSVPPEMGGLPKG
jgi:putative transposase